MRPLSIFSFDTLQARVQPALWMVAVPMLLAAAEIILRLPTVTAHLPQPEPTLWHAANVQAKLDYLQALESEQGVDVLFVGNSTVLAGVDPLAFDHARGRSADDPVSFNGALEGIPAAGAFSFVKAYLRSSQPTTIIYGVTPQDLNDNSPTGRTVTKKVHQSPMMIATTDDGPAGKLMSWLLENSTLFRYRTVLYQWLLSGRPDSVPKIYFNFRGFVGSEARLADIPAADRGRLFNNDGVLDYDSQGEQTAALSELVNYVRQHGSNLILVNMPLADDYYGNFASVREYAAYLESLATIAEQGHVPFWNMEADPQAPQITDVGFADFNHLNHLGAKLLSEQLGERFRKSGFATSHTEKRGSP